MMMLQVGNWPHAKQRIHVNYTINKKTCLSNSKQGQNLS